jgi:exodeoxyribonuclease VII small subunit
MKKDPTFEESLNRLTVIVEALEHDGTALAEAMKLYEEGIELSQRCRRELEQAEQKITELRTRAEGEFSEEEIEF